MQFSHAVVLAFIAATASAEPVFGNGARPNMGLPRPVGGPGSMSKFHQAVSHHHAHDAHPGLSGLPFQNHGPSIPMGSPQMGSPQMGGPELGTPPGAVRRRYADPYSYFNDGLEARSTYPQPRGGRGRSGKGKGYNGKGKNHHKGKGQHKGEGHHRGKGQNKGQGRPSGAGGPPPGSPPAGAPPPAGGVPDAGALPAGGAGAPPAVGAPNAAVTPAGGDVATAPPTRRWADAEAEAFMDDYAELYAREAEPEPEFFDFEERDLDFEERDLDLEERDAEPEAAADFEEDVYSFMY